MSLAGLATWVEGDGDGNDAAEERPGKREDSDL